MEGEREGGGHQITEVALDGAGNEQTCSVPGLYHGQIVPTEDEGEEQEEEPRLSAPFVSLFQPAHPHLPLQTVYMLDLFEQQMYYFVCFFASAGIYFSLFIPLVVHSLPYFVAGKEGTAT